MTDGETEHHVSESLDKYKATAKLVRGTEPRDKDTITLKAKGDDPEQVVEDIEEMVRQAEETAFEARNTQPEVEGDDDDDDGDGE